MAEQGWINREENSFSEKEKRSAQRRFIWRYIVRSRMKSILTLTVAMIFILTLSWLGFAIESNRREIGRLHETIVVKLEILPQNWMDRKVPEVRMEINQLYLRWIDNYRVVRPRTVQTILDSGVILNTRLESAIECLALSKPVPSTEDEAGYAFFDSPKCFDGVILEGYNDLEDFHITFIEPWEETLFGESWTRDDLEALDLTCALSEEEINEAEEYYGDLGFRRYVSSYTLSIPIIVHSNQMQLHGMHLGDTLYLIDQNDMRFEQIKIVSCVIVGSYTTKPGITPNSYGLGEPLPIVLAPLSVLETLAPLINRTFGYTKVSFTVDPKAYRSYLEKRDELWQVINAEDAGLVMLSARFWDDELRMVGGPIEKNLELMQVLYPVALGVAAIIAMGLTLLQQLQKAKETALHRMLGLPRATVCLLLCLELMMVNLCGAMMGILVFILITFHVSLAVVVQSLFAALLYLGGAFIGALVGVLAVTNRKPMELLQVRE